MVSTGVCCLSTSCSWKWEREDLWRALLSRRGSWRFGRPFFAPRIMTNYLGRLNTLLRPRTEGTLAAGRENLERSVNINRVAGEPVMGSDDPALRAEAKLGWRRPLGTPWNPIATGTAQGAPKGSPRRSARGGNKLLTLSADWHDRRGTWSTYARMCLAVCRRAGPRRTARHRTLIRALDRAPRKSEHKKKTLGFIDVIVGREVGAGGGRAAACRVLLPAPVTLSRRTCRCGCCSPAEAPIPSPFPLAR